MNPALARKAASLVVIPCDKPGKYHTAGADSKPHVVNASQIDASRMTCDCSQYDTVRRVCSHKLATRWYIDRQQTAIAS